MGRKVRAWERAGRPLLRSPGRPPVGRLEHRHRLWAAIGRGASSEAAAAEAGVSGPVGVRWFGTWRRVNRDAGRAVGALPGDSVSARRSRCCVPVESSPGMWCTGMRMAPEPPGASGPGHRGSARFETGLWENAVGQVGNSYGLRARWCNWSPLRLCPGVLRARIRRCRSCPLLSR